MVRTLYSKERAERHAALYALGREAVLRIADDVQGALQPRLAQPGEPALLFRGGSEGARDQEGSLEFVTMYRPRRSALHGRPGRQWVAYSLGADPRRRDTYTLWRSHQLWSCALAEAQEESSNPCDDLDPMEKEGDTPLLGCDRGESELPGSCVRVLGLRFAFFHSEGATLDAWDSYADDRRTHAQLPVAVQIALTLEDDAGRAHEFETMVDLPLAINQPTPRPDGSIDDDAGGDGDDGDDDAGGGDT